MPVSMLNVLNFFFVPLLSGLKREFYQCFDAQCFELFLYFWKDWQTNYIATEFRCSTFWAFSLLKYELMGIRNCMLWFRCSTFWTFSLSSLLLYHEWDSLNVSMLNVLSFFFIISNWKWYVLADVCFDAQRFELFLYP